MTNMTARVSNAMVGLVLIVAWAFVAFAQANDPQRSSVPLFWGVRFDSTISLGQLGVGVGVAFQVGRWGRRHWNEIKAVRLAAEKVGPLEQAMAALHEMVRNHLVEDQMLFQEIRRDLVRVEADMRNQASALEEHRRRGEQWRMEMLALVQQRQRDRGEMT